MDIRVDHCSYLFLSSESLVSVSPYVCEEKKRDSLAQALLHLYVSNTTLGLNARTCSWRGRCMEHRLAQRTAAHPQDEAGLSGRWAGPLPPDVTQRKPCLDWHIKTYCWVEINGVTSMCILLHNVLGMIAQLNWDLTSTPGLSWSTSSSWKRGGHHW